MNRVAIVGASGYTGAELVRILSRHPAVESLHLYAASGGEDRRFEQEHPALRHLFQGPIHEFQPESLAGLDAAFLALPHGASAQAAAALVDQVGIVVDLSGDLRLTDPEDFENWYGYPHPDPALAEHAVYGLPELNGDKLPGATLISNPGCYPTASTLALLPALEVPDLCGEDAVITAVSGASGAGRKPKENLLLSELHGNTWAYRLGSHQHVPEIQRNLEQAANREILLTFVPQVIPTERGILATASLPLEQSPSTEELVYLYEERYASCPFVRITGSRSPSLREVTGTNFCDIGVVADTNGGRLVAVAAIDNLVKGAAGQAVQNWNIAKSLPETAGLDGVPRQ